MNKTKILVTLAITFSLCFQVVMPTNGKAKEVTPSTFSRLFHDPTRVHKVSHIADAIAGHLVDLSESKKEAGKKLLADAKKARDAKDESQFQSLHGKTVELFGLIKPEAAAEEEEAEAPAPSAPEAPTLPIPDDETLFVQAVLSLDPDAAKKILDKQKTSTEKKALINTEKDGVPIVRAVTALCWRKIDQKKLASTLEFLIKNGADPDNKDSSGLTLLHIAAQCDSDETVGMLFKYAKNKQPKTTHGSTPLHYAAAKNASLAIMALLTDKATKIDPLDNNNCTPLHAAAHAGSFGAADTLLKNGANKNLKSKDKNETPLDFAQNQLKETESRLKSATDEKDIANLTALKDSYQKIISLLQST